MTIEIIGRGPSKHPPIPGSIRYWLDVSWNGEELGPQDMILSLHGPEAANPNLPNSPAVVTFERIQSLPLSRSIDPIVLSEHLGFGNCYASSVSWALGLAIEANPSTIILNGIDVIHQKELAQRESICYLVGIARSRGIRVQTVAGSGLRLSWGLYPRG